MKRAALLIGVLAVLVGASGCGSDEGSGEASGSEGNPSISKAEFAKQADAICAQAVKRRLAAVEGFEWADSAAEPTPAEEKEQLVAVVVQAVLPPLARMSDELSQLDLPQGEADKAEAMVEEFAAGVAKTEANPGKVVQAPVGPFEEATKLATDLKIKSCAEL